VLPEANGDSIFSNPVYQALGPWIRLARRPRLFQTPPAEPQVTVI